MIDIMIEIHKVHQYKLSRMMGNSLDYEDCIFFYMRDPNGSIFVVLSNMINNRS
jgi:hypothetical protein